MENALEMATQWQHQLTRGLSTDDPHYLNARNSGGSSLGIKRVSTEMTEVDDDEPTSR